MRYPLLLMELLSATPEAHPDKAPLTAAVLAVKEINVNINEYKRRKDLGEELGSAGHRDRSGCAGVGVCWPLSLNWQPWSWGSSHCLGEFGPITFVSALQVTAGCEQIPLYFLVSSPPGSPSSPCGVGDVVLPHHSWPLGTKTRHSTQV